MNKSALAMLMLALIFTLTACSVGVSNQPVSTALSSETKLALGTLRLENTTQGVDAAQAAVLLPLWQLLDQLETSGTAAQAEMDAVVDSIESAMTADQVQTIESMQLTQADSATVRQWQDPASTSSTNAEASGGLAQGVSPAMNGGDMPTDMGGGMPADGGMPGGSPPNSSQSNAAVRLQNSDSITSPASLTQQVIQLLQSKIEG